MTRLVVLQHLEREGPGLFAEESACRGWELLLCRLDQGEVPPHLESSDLLLVLGGPMGVSDVDDPAYPWLADELELLRQVVRRGLPVIGVCLGAQLLAAAAGGTAVPLQPGDPPRALREVGYGAVTWTRTPEQEPVLVGLDPSELVLHWHGDRCVLPPEAVLLGSSLHCQEQFFRLGSWAYGLQFHVEVERPQLERWLDEDHDYVHGALGDQGVERIRADAARWGDRAQGQGRRLIANLLSQLAAPPDPQ